MTPQQSLSGYRGICTFVLLFTGKRLPKKQTHKQRLQWIAWFNYPEKNEPPKEVRK